MADQLLQNMVTHGCLEESKLGLMGLYDARRKDSCEVSGGSEVCMRVYELTGGIALEEESWLTHTQSSAQSLEDYSPHSVGLDGTSSDKQSATSQRDALHMHIYIYIYI